MAPQETTVGGVDNMGLSSAFPGELGLGGADDLFGDGWQSRWSPLWLGALSTFVFVFFCGISMALYTGWQLVTNNLLAAQPEPGTIMTLAAGQRATEQVGEYILMTATSDAASVSAPWLCADITACACMQLPPPLAAGRVGRAGRRC